MKRGRRCHRAGLQNIQRGLDMAFLPGSERQRFPQFAGKWSFVVSLSPGSSMGLRWVRAQIHHFLCSSQWAKVLCYRWREIALGTGRAGAALNGHWVVCGPCTFGPWEVSGLALNYRENFTSFIKFSQIYIRSLFCSLGKGIGMET